MSSRVVNTGSKLVRPILSSSSIEARRRVINLYKAWYREIPNILQEMHLPLTAKQCNDKLRELFDKNRNVKDIRTIDMLVVKGQMELKDYVLYYSQETHLMRYWAESPTPKSDDFLGSFLQGK